jgi:N utilization substance protein A
VFGSKEILEAVELLSNEKAIGKDVVFSAVEAGLAAARRRLLAEDVEIRVAIDRHTGEQEYFRQWEVMEDEAEEIEAPTRQLRLAEARQIDPGAEPGGVVEKPMDGMDLGHIGAYTAKHVINQKVREAERALIRERYQGRIGELLSGVVKRVDRNGVYVDLGGGVEGFVPREHMIPREPIRPQDRVKGLLYEVATETRGPQLKLTRTSPEFLMALFRVEVPEVGQDLIEILGAARDPGARAKIAVRSREPRIDPVGACVGMRGSRVQAVTNEIAGERVDIILWDENPAQFVVNAMSPADVVSIVMDEEARSMDIAVDESQLAQAIGRGGQNVRLAMQLTGWNLNVMTEVEAEEKNEATAERLVQGFKDALDVDEEIATILVQEGFTGVDEVAYVPIEELQQIEEFDEELVDALRARARDVLVTQEIAREEELGGGVPDQDLVELEGMEAAIARHLATQGVVSRDDLADLATDELVEMTGISDEQAGQLIMSARAAWFEDDVA